MSANTSSDTMAASPRFDNVLQLGQELVANLKLTDSTDMLGHWMAHHLAEQIDKAQTSTGIEQHTAQRNCVDTIIAIWTHRAEMPANTRPFRNFEAVFRALESLDLSDGAFRYFGFRSIDKISHDDPDVHEALNMVLAIDDAAKVLIRYFLESIADRLQQDGDRWLKALAETHIDAFEERFVIKALTTNSDSDDSEQDDALKELRWRQVEKLDALIELADWAKAHLMAEAHDQ